MKKIPWLLLLFISIALKLAAQSGPDSSTPRQDSPSIPLKKITDSITITDSAPPVKDTALTRLVKPLPVITREPYSVIIRKNPFYNFSGKPQAQTFSRRAEAGKEGAFYLLAGVIFFFALIKAIFDKYLHNLFAVFFRVSMKQKQMREQLLQTPLPSLLLNLLFVMSAGIYIVYLLRHYQTLDGYNFWVLLAYSCGGLTLIYLTKLLVLKITGWVFNMKEATETYIFIVFLVNKLLGIFLLPLLLFIAFSPPALVSVAFTLSFILLILMFGYRYMISYSTVRKEIKVSPFHFFLYLCAFEIIPLILIYKVLFGFIYSSQ